MLKNVNYYNLCLYGCYYGGEGWKVHAPQLNVISCRNGSFLCLVTRVRKLKGGVGGLKRQKENIALSVIQSSSALQ